MQLIRLSLILLLLLFAVVGCSPSNRADEVEVPIAPAADRQAWGVRLEIFQPDLRVDIRAPFMQDIGRSTYADSGAEISFAEGESDLVTHVRAGRMGFNSSFLWLSGAVELVTGDSLKVRTDSLLWARDAGEFWIPEKLEMRLQSGMVGGSNMKTDLRLREWSLEQTRERWWTDGDSFSVAAGRQTGRREPGGIVVSYEDLTATFDDLEVRGARAVYLEKRAVVQFDGGVTGADSAHSFRAERMEYDLREQSFKASGQIELLADSVRITASEFVRSDGRESFAGESAQFWRGERTVAARQLSYDRSTGILRAVQTVSFREGRRSLTADELIYYREADSVAVDGPFSLTMPRMQGVATGGGLHYAVGNGNATMTEGPTFRRERDDGSHLQIRARTIAVDLKDEVLNCSGSFRAESTEAAIEAQSGLFENRTDQLTLNGDVHFRMRAAADSIVSFVQADSMLAELDGGKLAQVEIPDTLSGSIAGGAGRINWISARGGTLVLQEDELERVELRGGAKVTHRKLGKEEVSRFAGSEMTMEFRDRIMQRVHVRGKAEVVSRISKGKEEEAASMNRVEGERLVIEFSQGEIAAVRVLDSIKGRYYPPDKEEE